jgi:hypothetical protein
MNEKEFLNLVLQCANSYASAIQTGAQWEVAAQVFISMKMLEFYGVQGREIKYPDSDKKAVDLAFQINQINYAVEIKVESATSVNVFAGVSLNQAIADDTEKIKNFNMPGAVKWVVVIAYSVYQKKSLRNKFANGEVTAIDEEGPFVAALIKVA